ncbi:DUF2169 domain-containing protein [Pectobacterium parmentieri]|uniref:DUF2169 family type VI secretion system accessory protein n=1 Tax=Pectobacterium parmentieri TaxID=1905730 RepID=UPI000CDCFA90|nr:DUF2169 domain-containing protein [Pectobacterium parmentieri]AYH05896.1 DUF2169 domain-containing protein [Pectobacterium parmentieri]AYH14717.1 DUF2169 domain-containing protein [Pectobacterium parmentieri]AYH23418.1 DUF2169 domain-containing protein [Pectobacterium parmentieri]MBI0520658.1 DUF2169 domain-containing protein [Pectobacterium parmentieri]MBN3177925.1 DUF2169 domain-containing protein [Pectobacterium parmentieri]
MENFANYSAFPAQLFESIDQHDHGFSVLVARVSYDLDIISGKLTLSEDQGELVEQDEYYDEPGSSSVRFESDLAPYKPRLDVVINGTAWAPEDKAVRQFTVGVRIGDFMRLLNVYGPREWRNMVASWQLTEAKPITNLDLRYEYAQGGCYRLEKGEVLASASNSVGIGWLPAKAQKQLKLQRVDAPQFELLPQPIKHIDDETLPAGFGFYGRGWTPRIGFAGTHDDAWKQQRHPFLPEDFRFDYWCGAHPWMQFPLPKPLLHVPVMLKNLVSHQEKAGQEINFAVPVETLFAFVTTQQGAGVTFDLQLDTLVIDLPSRKVHCSYRAVFSEQLEAAMTELRFIAVDERNAMVQRSQHQLTNAQDDSFTPLPPSLAALISQEQRHG